MSELLARGAVAAEIEDCVDVRQRPERVGRAAARRSGRDETGSAQRDAGPTRRPAEDQLAPVGGGGIADPLGDAGRIVRQEERLDVGQEVGDVDRDGAQALLVAAEDRDPAQRRDLDRQANAAPEPADVLVDEVELEHPRARPRRRRDPHGDEGVPAGRDGPREGRPQPVSDHELARG